MKLQCVFKNKLTKKREEERKEGGKKLTYHERMHMTNGPKIP